MGPFPTVITLVVGAAVFTLGHSEPASAITHTPPAPQPPQRRVERLAVSVADSLRADARDGDLTPGAVRALLEGFPGLIDRSSFSTDRISTDRINTDTAEVRSTDGVSIGISHAVGEGQASGSALAVVPTSQPSTEAALQISGETIRALVVLNAPDAPVEHRFRIALPDGWTAVADRVGGYLVFDGPAWGDRRPPAGVIGAPWAYDANGVPLAVTQQLIGDEIVLRIDHAGAAYPVVADPSYSRLRCARTSAFGTTDEYLNGTTCPTQAFFNRHGYFPVWGVHQGVSRAVEQRGECSWYPDTGPYWDFQTPCKAHDYCWDLVRMNKYVNRSTYTKVTEGRCDQLFRDDLFRHCESPWV